MRLNRNTMLSLALALAPTAASAWEYERDRGLDSYNVRDDGVSLTLVCDPNKVYGGTTETALLVAFGGNVDASIPVTIRFPDGISIQAELVHGRIGQADTEAGNWQALVEGLRAYPDLIVEGAGEARYVELGQPMMFSCT